MDKGIQSSIINCVKVSTLYRHQHISIIWLTFSQCDTIENRDCACVVVSFKAIPL